MKVQEQVELEHGVEWELEVELGEVLAVVLGVEQLRWQVGSWVEWAST